MRNSLWTGASLWSGASIAGAGLILSLAGVHASAESQKSAGRELLGQYCYSCHSEKLKAGGLALERLDPDHIGANAAVWEKVVRKLHSGMMPPPGLPQPPKAGRNSLVTALEGSLDKASAEAPNPGRVETFHRLNRTEYQNAVRDLLDLDIDAASLLPVDDVSHGFDNMAGLRISTVLMERYAAAARKISRLAVGDMSTTPAEEEFRVSSELRQDERFAEMPFGTRGGAIYHYTFPLDAEYAIQIKLSGAQTADRHELEVSIDGERVKLFEIGARGNGRGSTPPSQAAPTAPAPRQQKDLDAGDEVQPEKGYSVRIPVKAGPHDVMAVFLTKTEAVPETTRKLQLRPAHNAGGLQYEPYVASVIVGGPYKATGPGDTPSRRRIFSCHPGSSLSEGACAKQILTSLARRAYRRPPTPEDIQELLKFYDLGRSTGTFDSGIEMSLRMLLASPNFLVRIERDPAGAKPGTNYRIGSLELASRLSFFLWSSIPDDELLDQAMSGKLSDPDVQVREVRRMLADPRSEALVRNFTAQWLYLRNLESVLPDEELFSNFDDNLRDAFRSETEMFFGSIMRDDRSVVDLIGADYTFLNERLAKHYGIPNVYGSNFRRITLPPGVRGGLLGQGAILTVTSNALRTSPVSRGKWILENLLGSPPPEPPPNVPALKENTEGAKAMSVRERLEEHRRNPACASCHQIMDPLGFALENYDAVGTFRTRAEDGLPIDASGQLLDGTKISGASDLKKALLSHPADFAATFSEKMMTYALGRGVEYYDQPAIRAITREASQSNYKFSSLILGIVRSMPFQMRRTQS
jgi:mono/diheme cytochrome c family protein